MSHKRSPSSMGPAKKPPAFQGGLCSIDLVGYSPLSRTHSSHGTNMCDSSGLATSRQCCSYLMQLRAIVLGCYVAMAITLAGSVVPISCSSELWSHQTVCIMHTICFEQCWLVCYLSVNSARSLITS